MIDFLFEPFAFGFMRRALTGCLALSIAGPPLGVFLVLRRMSLMSDVLQHGILPGIALGAVFGGISVLSMGFASYRYEIRSAERIFVQMHKFRNSSVSRIRE